MNYTISLTGEQLSLVSMALNELPEKVRFPLFAHINAQLKEQNDKIVAEAAEAAEAEKARK